MIYLIGFMGVGKTTVGKIVAKKQGLEFIDTDRNIEENCSMKQVLMSLKNLIIASILIFIQLFVLEKLWNKKIIIKH